MHMATKSHLCAAALVAALALASSPTRARQDRDAELQLSGAEVLLDLVVTDKKGRPVTDLKPGEIELFEDGERQAVSSFDLVRVGPRPGGAAEDGPAARGPLARSPLRNVNLILVVVDRSSVQQGNLVQVARAAERFVNERLATNDLVAVFATTSRLVMLQNFTSNKTKLLDAIRLATQGTSVGLRESLDPVDRQKLAAEQSLPGDPPPLPGDAAANDARLYATLDRNAAGIDSTFASLRDQIQALSVINGLLTLTKVYSNVEGRKSILLYSEGFVVTDDTDAALEAAVAAANRNNFTIYAVSAAGLEATVRTGAVQPRTPRVALEESDARMTVSGGESGLDRMVRPTLTNNDQALARIASETGGILVRNTNDLGRGFDAIENDLRAYYALSYAPTRPELDGSYRAIEVRVARKDVEVRARKGYFAVPGGGDALLLPYERPLLAMLAKAPADAPSELAVAMKTERFPAPGGWLVPVVLSVDAAALAPAAKADGETVDFEVDAVVLVRDAGGRVVAKLSRPTVYRADRKRLDEFRGQAVPLGPFPQPLVLGAGRYSLEVGVYDPNGRRGTVVERAVTIPALPAPGEPALSTLVLSRAAETVAEATRGAADPFLFDRTTRVMPWASARFVKSRGDRLIAFFRLRARPGAEYQMRLQFVLGDRVVVSTKPSPLPPADTEGRTSAAPVLALDAFEPGAYRAILHILAPGETKPVATAMASFQVDG